jgi:hypothetical protein
MMHIEGRDQFLAGAGAREEHLALRLPLPERDAFLAKYQTVLCEQHGKVMTGVRRGARQSASRRRRASAALRSQLHLRQFAEAETHEAPRQLDAQDVGVHRGQSEWVVTRRPVAGGQVGHHQTRPQSFRSRSQMRVVGGETAIGEYDIEP